MSENQKRPYFILSDLHLEFRRGAEEEYWANFPKTDTKVCLCAGDVTSFGLSITAVHRHFKALCDRFEKVIYVPGNHEYYGSDPEQVGRKLGEIERTYGATLKVLRSGEPYVYEGQRFIGDTMWFVDKPEVHIYRRTINDSFQIKNLFPWCFTESNLFMAYVAAQLQEDDIVITHHVPNNVDTRPEWMGSTTQPYFINDACERYFQNPNSVRPKAWIYGHTHDYHLYKLGRTQFVCNPAGYPGEREAWRTGQLVYEL
jgi:predicted phosphodiesterase